MKLCVFGAGAVGGHIAAKLAAAGHEVSVVARGQHLAAMHANGIRLVHGSRTIVGRVRAAANARELGPQDAVLVTLKANLLGAFAEQCAPLLGRDTAVLFVQNGIPWWYDERLVRLDPHPPPDRDLAPIASRAREEAAAIARALGVAIERAPRRPSGKTSSGAAHKPSMLQDYERGRPMEIEAQLNAPLELARAAKVHTPTLDILVPLVAAKAAAKGLATH